MARGSMWCRDSHGALKTASLTGDVCLLPGLCFVALEPAPPGQLGCEPAGRRLCLD